MAEEFNVLLATDQEPVADEEPNAASIAWCKNQFSLIKDGGSWIVPRSGMIFEKQGEKLVLTIAMGSFPEMTDFDRDFIEDQKQEYRLIKKHFAAAGIPVESKLEEFNETTDNPISATPDKL